MEARKAHKKMKPSKRQRHEGTEARKEREHVKYIDR